MAFDTAIQLRINRIHADLATALPDLENIVHGEPKAAQALRGRLRPSIAALSALAHETMVADWLASTAMFWSLRQVPWTELADALPATPGSRPSRTRLDKTLAAVFGDDAPPRRPATGRESSGYPVLGMWAAITEWHLAVGLPIPVDAWRVYPEVRTVLDVFPALADDPEAAARGSRPVAIVRAAGNQVPQRLESLITEAARRHYPTVRRWVQHARQSSTQERPA